MSRAILVVVGALLLAACGAPKKDDSGLIVNGRAKDRIDSTLRGMVDSARIAGASALIFENDKEVYYNSFGYADREAREAFDRNTIVRIFSMTKPITGVALMQLYERGMFKLDDPLSKYLPEFSNMKVFNGLDKKGKMKLSAPKRPILVRDITRHTAGFANGGDPNLGEMMKQSDPMNRNNTLSQMTAKLAKLPLAFSPGDQWAYGICVDVQAALVERLSGQPFDQYVRENVLDPLKMNSTRYVPMDTGRFAAAYLSQEGKLNRMPDSVANLFNSKEWPLKPGGYGLTSTIDDYMRFARMLVHEGTLDSVQILRPETIRLMATNQLSDSITQRMWLPSKGQVGFGIDFAVRLRQPADAKENNGFVGEFFWDGAASTLFWVDPKNKLTAVLFVQIFPFSNPLHKGFRDAVYGKVVK
jgi:CubicO group peptidase (beta-lactamase class C family)